MSILNRGENSKSLNFFLVLTFVFLFVSYRNGYCSTAAPTLEEKVKAAYILNFIRYTDWPTSIFSSPDNPLVICALSDDSFVEILQKTVSGAKIFTRKIEIKQLKHSLDDLNKCHVLFIARNYSTELDLNNLKQKSLLSISDNETFFKQGGVISFVVYEKTIQFNVNLQAADQAGLKLSSRMLALAKNVVREKRE